MVIEGRENRKLDRERTEKVSLESPGIDRQLIEMSGDEG